MKNCDQKHPIQLLSNILAQTEVRMSLRPLICISVESIPKDINIEELMELWHHDQRPIVYKANTSPSEPLTTVSNPEPLINISL